MAKLPQAVQTARLTVRLTPRGGRDGIDGWIRDAEGLPCLKVRVSSPPVDGAANEALERLIAATLRVPGGAVRIIAGHQARVKRLEIDGMGEADLARVFGAAG